MTWALFIPGDVLCVFSDSATGPLAVGITDSPTNIQAGQSYAPRLAALVYPAFSGHLLHG